MLGVRGYCPDRWRPTLRGHHTAAAPSPKGKKKGGVERAPRVSDSLRPRSQLTQPKNNTLGGTSLEDKASSTACEALSPRLQALKHHPRHMDLVLSGAEGRISFYFL